MSHSGSTEDQIKFMYDNVSMAYLREKPPTSDIEDAPNEVKELFKDEMAL